MFDRRSGTQTRSIDRDTPLPDPLWPQEDGSARIPAVDLLEPSASISAAPDDSEADLDADAGADADAAASGTPLASSAATPSQVSAQLEATFTAASNLIASITVEPAIAVVDTPAVNDAPTFVVTTAAGAPGKLIQPLGAGGDGANTVAVQADGKVLLAGYAAGESGGDLGIVRLLVDGSLDPDFGNGGQLILPVGSGEDSVYAMALQSDGRILLFCSVDGAADGDVAVLRLLADGTLDGSFGSDGIALLPDSGGGDFAGALALQADGRIVLAGTSWNGSNSDCGVWRLLADGTLDSSFGSGGQSLLDFGVGDDGATAVAVQSNGKIVLVGSSFNGSNFDLTVARLNTDGSLDTTFNATGTKLLPVGSGDDFASCVAVQSDGKIILGGSTETASGFDMVLLRLNTNGALDTTFNGSGRLTIAVGSGDDQAYGLVLQPDGKIVLTGQAIGAGGTTDFAAVRVNADGTLDTGFNATGKQIVAVGSGDDSAYAVARLTDGDILLAGVAVGSADQDMGLVRLDADGSLDTAFYPASVSTLGGTVSFAEGGAAVLLDARVAVQDAELAALDGGAGRYEGAMLTLERQGGDRFWTSSARRRPCPSATGRPWSMASPSPR